jgi:hypothetical protein
VRERAECPGQFAQVRAGICGTFDRVEAFTEGADGGPGDQPDEIDKGKVAQ